MMIAIVVIIAAVVAAFAYGIIGGVKKAPSSAMVVEGVKVGDLVDVTVLHHGCDAIREAFETDASSDPGDKWNNLQVRLNGEKLSTAINASTALTMNGVDCNTTWASGTFSPGDQITITFGRLNESDSIVILHVPSENILQRLTVSG
jgi:FlaG/FlaF family flagellin (archaellin)